MISMSNIGWTKENTCEGVVRFYGADDKTRGTSCLFWDS